MIGPVYLEHSLYVSSSHVHVARPLQIHLGGVDTFLQPGKRLNVRRNFEGCMENVWWNYMNIIKDTRMGQERFQSQGAIQYGVCQVRQGRWCDAREAGA